MPKYSRCSSCLEVVKAVGSASNDYFRHEHNYKWRGVYYASPWRGIDFGQISFGTLLFSNECCYAMSSDETYETEEPYRGYEGFNYENVALSRVPRAGEGV
jgi:hypothetical protein